MSPPGFFTLQFFSSFRVPKFCICYFVGVFLLNFELRDRRIWDVQNKVETLNAEVKREFYFRH